MLPIKQDKAKIGDSPQSSIGQVFSVLTLTITVTKQNKTHIMSKHFLDILFAVRDALRT